MSRPFLDTIDWPGRDITDAEVTPDTGSAEPEETDRFQPVPFPQPIPKTEFVRVRNAFNGALAAQSALEHQADEMLNAALHVPIQNRPQTAESVRFIAGTHPDFGTVRPEVPDEDQLPDNEINADIYRRARRTMDHADRIMFGFDVAQLADPEYEGYVRSYGPITSPAEASGERPPEIADERVRMEEVTEERLQMKKQSIWKMIFWAVMSFILRFIGDVFMEIYDWARRKLSFKILGKRISIGKWIAKPFKWIAELFYDWADWFEEKAMGNVPKPPMEPDDLQSTETPSGGPPAEDRAVQDLLEEGPGPTGDPVLDVDDEDFDPELDETDFGEISRRIMENGSWNADRGVPAGSGMEFLMHAQRIVQASAQSAERIGNEAVFDAIDRYERSRQTRRVLNAYGDITRHLGVPLGENDERFATPDAPATAEPNRPFDC